MDGEGLSIFGRLFYPHVDKEAMLIDVTNRNDVQDIGAAHCDRACLVHRNRFDGAQIFKVLTSFDQNAISSCLGNARKDS